MDVLPSEVWVCVLGWVADASDVVRFGLTCRTAHLLAAEPSLWRALYLRHLSPTSATKVQRAVEGHQRRTTTTTASTPGVRGGEWRQLCVERSRRSVRCLLLGRSDSGKSVLMARLGLHLGVCTNADFERADQMCWRPGTSTDEGETYVALCNMLPRAFPGFGDDLFDASWSRDVVLLEAKSAFLTVFERLDLLLLSDCHLLVVDAAQTDLEGEGSYVRNMLQLLRLTGKRAIVAVNKLDHFSSEAAQLRWNEIVSMLTRDWPMAAGDTTVVPISALGDINIGRTSPSSFDWYSGPTLLDAILRLPAPQQRPRHLSHVDRPCTVLLLDSYNEAPERSFLGLVMAGVLLKDVQFVCLAMLANEAHHAEVTFDSIVNINSRERAFALPGDIVQVSMRVPLPLEPGMGGSNAYVFVEAGDKGRSLRERHVETMEVEFSHALPKILVTSRLYLHTSVGERLDVCPCSVLQAEPIRFAGEGGEGLRIMLALNRLVPAAFLAFSEFTRFTLGGTRTPLVARIVQCTFTS